MQWYAFAARLVYGSVVTSGDKLGAGDSSSVQHQLQNVEAIYSAYTAFGNLACSTSTPERAADLSNQPSMHLWPSCTTIVSWPGGKAALVAIALLCEEFCSHTCLAMSLVWPKVVRSTITAWQPLTWSIRGLPWFPITFQSSSGSYDLKPRRLPPVLNVRPCVRGTARDFFA